MPNIRDVARVAGVSIATVSRVINGHPRVSERTRKKVLKAMKELHYRPVPSPRKSLRLFGTLGVLMPDLMGYHYNEILMAIEHHARENKFDTMVAIPKGLPAREMEVLDEYFKKKVDGVIIFELRGNETVLEKFMRSGIPITAVDYKMEEIKVDSVNVDNMGGAYSAMRYLYERGHRKILFIPGPENVHSACDRREGVEKFVKKHEDVQVFMGESQGFEPEDGYLSVKIHLAKYGKNFTAIFAVCDYTALGALWAVAEAGLQIPKDISVISFDDSPFAAYTVPPLTTVLQPRWEMGVVATQLLIERLTSPRNRIHRNVVLPTRIVERKSVATVS